jgi:hypothetical protein
MPSEFLLDNRVHAMMKILFCMFLSLSVELMDARPADFAELNGVPHSQAFPTHKRSTLTSVPHSQAFHAQRRQPSKPRDSVATPDRRLIYSGLRYGNIDIRAFGLYRIRVQLSAVSSFKRRSTHHIFSPPCDHSW